MDFDEYDYLEKAVEEPEIRKESSEKRSSRNRRGDDDGEVDVDEGKRSSRNRRGGEDEDDVDVDEGRSKKLRLESENGGDKKEKDYRSDRRDRDKEKEKDRYRSSRDVERDSDRDRDRDRDRRDRDRDRGGRDRKEREREREKVREKDRGDDKERVREKDRDSERERERERSRRSSSHSRRHRSSVDRDVDAEIVRAKSRDREARERSRDRELREREEEMERERERERERRFKDKKEAQEPEADPERDQRTVFAYQMPLKATERDVYEFFSQAGKVRDVRLIMDRNSRRSKGVGYVEFYEAMSVPMAIALCGHNLMGQPVMVKPSEAEKNLVQSTAAGGVTGVLSGPYGAVARKLYVGNLHFNMTEDQLRAVFEPFGPVELVQLPLDLESGLCKGFGFVQFAQLEHAKAAQSLNGKLEIAGRVIKVSAVTDHIGVQNAGANAADFDDEDGFGGLSLNAQSRAMLMQKLDRTGIATSIVGSLGVPALNGSGSIPLPVSQGMGFPGAVAPPAAEIPVGTPSLCLLLMNMFDPAAENEPDFDLDIKEEVQEECSKYGPVKHIHVEKESAGHVYLRFESVVASAAAQRSMHMRWFAGRRIVAVFMEPRDYENKFPGS